MKLNDYLKSKGMSQAEFGKMLKPPMSQVHVSQVITGRLRISLARAVEIEELTKGEVTVRDWLKEGEQAA